MACWLLYSFTVLPMFYANALPLLFDCLLALILLSIYVDINGLLHIFIMMPKGGSKLLVAK